VESYGAGIYWQIALGGLLAGAASGGLDAGHYYSIDRPTDFLASRFAASVMLSIN